MNIYLSIILIFLSSLAYCVPQTTEFTFQGELISGGSPANGEFDVNFRVYDAQNGGSEVATVEFKDNLMINNGLIQTDLDYGDMPFAGEAVWIQVEIRPGDENGAFEVLSPRQKVTITPYAIQSMFVADGGITASSIANNAVGSSAVNSNEIQLRITGSCPAGEAIQSINMDGTLNCASTADSDWTETASFLTTNKNVGINTSSTIGSGTFIVSGPFQDTFGGMFVNVNGTGFEQPFYGFATNESFRAWVEFAENDDQLRSNINNNYQMYLEAGGRLGINEPNPQRNLHVDGNARIEDLGYAGSGMAPVMVQPDGDLVTGDIIHTIAVPPAAFTVEELDDDFQKVLGSGHAFINSGFGALSAPVYFPDGVTVTRVDVWYLDESPENMTLRLRRSPHATVNSQDLAAILPTGSASGIRIGSDTSINLAQIDNDNYSYFFRVFSSNWTGGNMGIKAVKISYRY